MEEIIKYQGISNFAIKQDLRGVSLIHLYKNTVFQAYVHQIPPKTCYLTFPKILYKDCIESVKQKNNILIIIILIKVVQF